MYHTRNAYTLNVEQTHIIEIVFSYFSCLTILFLNDNILSVDEIGIVSHNTLVEYHDKPWLIRANYLGSCYS